MDVIRGGRRSVLSVVVPLLTLVSSVCKHTGLATHNHQCVSSIRLVVVPD